MGLVPNDNVPLTSANPKFEETRRRTVPGMAHWAGSGPPNKACIDCVFWTGCGQRIGYFSKTGTKGGLIKPRACAKYRAMMHAIGPATPHSARACKYFEASPNPPTITDKK